VFAFFIHLDVIVTVSHIRIPNVCWFLLFSFILVFISTANVEWYME